MIWSGATVTRSSGATRPRCTVKGFIACPSALKLPIANVGEVTSDGRRGRHHRANQVSPPTAPLTPFKIAIAGGGAALSRLQNVRIHSKAHRASRLAPLKPRVLKNSIHTFLLRRPLPRSPPLHHPPTPFRHTPILPPIPPFRH